MIRPYDSWTLAKLLSVGPVDEALKGVSEGFRPLADHLAGLPLEGREPALDAFLVGRADKDEIIKALADADPEGPAPEAETGGDEWPPLRFGALPPAEPFPVDILPESAARLVIEGAAAIGCPSDFLGVPVLAVAGGAIGRSVALLLKSGYFASATIFAACVGPPSDGKTPALKAAAGPLRQIDADLEAEYEQKLKEWQEASSRPGPDGKKPRPLPPPKPQRIDVDDITMEAVPLILASNPRGLVMVRDELSALALGMNQFKGGKGNDRPTVLKIWSGDAIKKDRVNHEANAPIRCAHPCLSIVGGMTPDMLRSMADPQGRADGFLDRFLFAYPDSLPVAAWSERGVPEETADDWSDLVARLWQRPMAEKGGRKVPHVARFTPEGKAEWHKRYDAHVAEMNAPDFDPAFRGPWGKLREYAGRFALILACLDHAADLTRDSTAVPDVGPATVVGAWRLVAYFKTHARRVHAAMAHGSGIGGGPAVKAIVDWLRDGPHLSFSEHDIKQARRRIEPVALERSLAYLTTRNAIRERPAVSTGGRPRSPVYDVNPALLATQNP
jgi:hypothetical protein